MIIDGKLIASNMREEIKSKNTKAKVVSVIIGSDAGAESYLKMMQKTCESVNFDYDIINLPATIDVTGVLDTINKLNNDPNVNGILFQRPLPKHIDEMLVMENIAPNKDIDGTNPINIGKLFLGEAGLRPCTPQAVIKVIEESGIDLNSKHVVVIGRSNIVGKPLAMLLLEKNATVTICHSKTKNLSEITKSADIIVVAVGRAKFLTKDMVTEKSIVIDVGTNMLDGKLTGDADFENLKDFVAMISPVPGGVGPVTNAILMRNVIDGMVM